MTYPTTGLMSDAARERPALWRLLGGVSTVAAIVVGWMLAVVWGVSHVQDSSYRDAARLIFDTGRATPQGTIVLLLCVAGLGFGTCLGARLWHRRSYGSLFGPAARTLRNFVQAGAVTALIVALLAILPPWPEEGDLVRQMDVRVWAAWLPLAILALLIQTGSEELFFRGYLQSQIAARAGRTSVAVAVAGLFFGIAHFSPALPTPNGYVYLGFAALFGVLAGDLTARTGSIGAAWGWHFVNNAMGVLVIATEGSLSGMGLWRTTVSLDATIALSPGLALDVAVLFLVWYAIRRVLGV